jgi:hypothetical protein
VAALLAFRLAANIPLPGIDRQALATAFGALVGGGAVERLSIGALGMIPLFSAMALAEVAKLLAPQALRARWPSHRAPDWVLWLGLGFAALQAGGIASALEQAGGPSLSLVAEPGTQFRIVVMATLVTATALFWWLAGLITRHGLGSGFWLLFLASFLGELPRAAGQAWEIVSVGAAPISAPLMLLALAVASLGIVVFLYQRLDRRERGEIILWPALLAPVVLNLMLIPISAFTLVTSTDHLADLPTWFMPGKATWLIVVVALMALVIVVRNRRSAHPLPPRQLALLTAGLAAIVVAHDLVDPSATGFVVNASLLIAAGVVMLTILRDIAGADAGRDVARNLDRKD